MTRKTSPRVLELFERLQIAQHEQRVLYAMEEEDMTDEQIKEYNKLHVEIREIYEAIEEAA